MKIIRASAIGHPCIRRVWYEMMGNTPVFDRRSLRNFKLGNALEPVVVDELREDGWEVVYNQGSLQAPVEIQIEISDDAMIAGHPDVCIRRGGDLDGPPPMSYLGDIKTMNATGFSGWRYSGTLKKYPQYADQLTVYAEGLRRCPVEGWEFEQLAVIGFNKNNGQKHIDVFDFSPERLEGILERARLIAGHDDAPEPDKLPTWACNYCGFAGICTRAYGVAKTANEDQQELIVSDHAVSQATLDLLEARKTKSEAEAAETEAKETIKAFSQSSGMKRFSAGGALVEIRSYPKSSIDTKELESKYPEVAAKVRKTTEYTTISVSDSESGS